MKHDLDIDQPIEVSAHPCLGCAHWRPGFVAYYDATDELVAGFVYCRHPESAMAIDFSCREEAKPTQKKRQPKGKPKAADDDEAAARRREYNRRYYHEKRKAKAEEPKRRGRPPKQQPKLLDRDESAALDQRKSAQCPHPRTGCKSPGLCPCSCQVCAAALLQGGTE